MQSLSRKECMFSRFCAREDHVFQGEAPPAAIRGVQIPVCNPNIVAERVPERSRNSVDGCRTAFEFEEGADRRLVQIQMQTRQAEAGAVFLVAERRAKSDSLE